MSSVDFQKMAHSLLLAHKGKGLPEGDPPTAEELCSLLEGKLSFSRKQQVYSHLNRSSELLGEWVRLIEHSQDAGLGSRREQSSLINKIRAFMAIPKGAPRWGCLLYTSPSPRDS